MDESQASTALRFSAMVIKPRPLITRSASRSFSLAISASPSRSEEHTSELQSQFHLFFPLFFLNQRRPPDFSPFPLPAALPTCRGKNPAPLDNPLCQPQFFVGDLRVTV